MDVAFGQLDRFVQDSHAQWFISYFSDLGVLPETGQGLAIGPIILE
jgi:hypothetical protein